MIEKMFRKFEEKRKAMSEAELAEAKKEFDKYEKRVIEILEINEEELALIVDKFPTYTDKLSTYLADNAEKLSLEMPNVAPYGNYGKMIEDNDGMAHFFKTEANKPSHWEYSSMGRDEKRDNLFSITLYNAAVNDGDAIKGCVFINRVGDIKHLFVVYED